MPILDISVIAGTDDGVSSDMESFNEIGQDVTVGTVDGDHYDSFFRFRNVTIPQGATIDVAYLTYVDAGGADPATFTSRIYLNDVDDATVPADRQAHTEKARTSAFTIYSDLTGNVQGEPFNTPSLVGPVQEVVNRPGWVSGNAMLVLWDSVDPSVGYLELAAYEFPLPEYAPVVLHVEYSEPITENASNEGVRKPPSPRARH